MDEVEDLRLEDRSRRRKARKAVTSSSAVECGSRAFKRQFRDSEEEPIYVSQNL